MGLRYIAEGMTPDQLREAVDYNPETGEFTWRRRPDRSVQWNGRHAGKQTGWRDHNGYIIVNINDRHWRAHRLAWLYMMGEWPEHDIDHINGDPQDNRLVNLRAATRSQNSGNGRKHKDNTSGFKGAYWNARRHMWLAQIMVARRVYNLGYYTSAEAAHAAYCTAARRLHGEFHRKD